MQVSVRRSLAWMMLSQGGLFVIMFGASVIIARLLTPYEMGIYAVANAAVGLLGAIRATGLGHYIIREPELPPHAGHTAFTINAILAMITSLAIVLMAQLGGALFEEPAVHLVLLMLCPVPLASILDFLPAAMLERAGAFRALAALTLLRVAVTCTVSITLAFNGFSYMAIVWGTLIGTFASALFTNIIGRHHVSVRLGLRDWRVLTRFGVQMLTINIVVGIAGRLSEIILGRLAGLATLGLYGRASGLNNLLWDNVHMVISRIVFVDFAERRRRGLPLRETYLNIVAMVTGLLWPAFAGLAILAGPVIHTLYGPAWTAAALPLSMLSIAGIVLTSITMTGEIYMVSGEQTRQIRFELKRNAIGLILFSLGSLGGIVWAAASRIGEAIVMVLLCRFDLNQMTQTNSPDYLPIFTRSAALTLIAVAPSALFMIANDWDPALPILPVLASVAAGIAMWLIALWRLRHPLFQEFERLRHHLPQRAVPDA